MSRLPPIMLVNGLHDPATTITSALFMREQAPTGFNVFRATGGHTSYKHKGETARAMDEFLVNGTIPKDGTVYST